MAHIGAYGSRMAAHLHLDDAPFITVETKRKSILAITRLRSETGMPRMSACVPAEKAFTITLQLRDNPDIQLWLGQTMVHTGRYIKSSVSIVDLEQQPTLYTPHPLECLQFYVPRSALDEIAFDNNASIINKLTWPQSKVDPNFHHLAMSILPGLENPGQASRLFLDQLTLALLAYVAQTYGGMRSDTKTARGGLAPWQMRRATEILRDRLDTDVSLSEVAAECRLSVSHFARSFKQAIGQTPHRWLLDRRVDAAKNLMLHSAMGLSEIALGCGFADQTSFSRAFKKIAGTSPGDWRRSCRT